MNLKELDDFQHDMQYFDDGWEAVSYYLWKLDKSVNKLTKTVKDKE